MTEPPLLYEVQDYVATITLNRPEKMNAFNPTMLQLWADAIESAGHDEGVRVVVVTGKGRGFCSGGDVSKKEVGGDLFGESLVAGRNGLRHSVHQVPRALANLEKPYIAAVNGAAVGAGMDMASMADMRIVSDRAKFGMAYVRVGLTPGDGGAYFLPKIVGMARALELMWSGRIFTAQEALEMGYAQRVVPHEELIPAVRSFATELARGPAVAVQLTKRLAYRSQEVGLHEALEMAEHAMVLARATEDSREGPRAFAEKRAPVFQGR